MENNLSGIAQETEKDATLQELMRLTLEGWASNTSALRNDLKPYAMYKDEFTIFNKIVLKANHIIIPTSSRHGIINKLYKSHLGIVNTKQLVRYFGQVLANS